MNLISRLSLSILAFTLILSFVLAGNIDNTKYSANKKGRFTENKGQIKDQNWQPRPDVLFSGESNGLVYHLKKDGLHYQLSRVETWKDETEALSMPGMDKEARKVPDQISLYRVDVSWVGANPFCEIIVGEASSDYENYYNVPDGVEPALFVKSYASVTYKNLYDHVDLKFYKTPEGELEYDFIVHPGGDYKQIRIDIQGGELSLNRAKELEITTPFGTITEGALKVMQEGKELKAAWHLSHDKQLTFEIEKFNPMLQITIDPLVRVWGTFYGGGDNDKITSLTVKSNEIHAIGYTASSSLIATSSSFQNTLGGNYDIFWGKFNSDGELLYCTYLGGQNNDFGMSISMDSNKNIYLTGSTSSNSGISSNGSYQPSLADPGFDAFLTKFDSLGFLTWSTYYGGGNYDCGYFCCIDNKNNILILGATSSGNNMSISNAYQPSLADPGFDGFFAKFNGNGQRTYATYYGGAQDDVIFSGAIDSLGNLYFVGVTESSNNITTVNSHQYNFGGVEDGFIVKMDSNYNRIWGTCFGGSDGDSIIACSLKNDKLLIAGSTRSYNNIASSNAYQSSLNGNYDAFFAEFDTTGQRIYCTYFGGSDDDFGQGCFYDENESIYLFGSTRSNNAIATSNAFQNSLSGNYDIFFEKFDSSHMPEYGTYYGGVNDDLLLSVAVQGNSIVFGGWTSSASGISTTNSFQEVNNGQIDGLIIQFGLCENTTDTINAISCGNYYYNNITYNMSGSYVFDYNSIFGCDSLVLLNLIIHQPYFDTISMTGCDSIVFNNLIYHISGIYTQFFLNSQGCDSTIVLDLIINSSPDTTFLSATACNSYTLNSTTYTLTGIYYQNLTNVSGCDSIVVLNLTIQNSSVPTDIYLTGYGQVTLNDSTYSISGNYSQILTNAAGCDSVLNIFVTILTPISAGLDKILCSGASTNMTADLPSGYTGFWTKIAGVGTIISPTSPTSQIKNISVGSSGTFVWTATDGILSSIDTVVIYRANLPANVTITNVTSTTVTFSWSAAIDPDSFFVRITENCTFSGAGQNFRVPGNVRSWTATGLKGCFNYCVKLRAQCNGINGPFYSGFSAPSSFNTSGPVSCGIVNGFSVTGIQGCTYKINWANATGCVTADSFRVRYREGSNAFINSPFTTGNSINLNLGVGTWEIRVQTWCNGQAVGTSPSGVYYTISDCTLPYSVTTTQNSGCNYKIQWEHCGASDSFRVKYRTGTNPYANSPFTTGNFVNLNLSAGAWDFRVQAWCNGASLGLTPVYTFSFPSCREAGYYNQGNEIISNLKLYPNPTQIKSYLSFTSGIEKEYRLKLSDITGKEIRTWEGNTIIGENTIEIPTSTLSAGMYFISFSLNNSKHELKLIVE